MSLRIHTRDEYSRQDEGGENTRYEHDDFKLRGCGETSKVMLTAGQDRCLWLDWRKTVTNLDGYSSNPQLLSRVQLVRLIWRVCAHDSDPSVPNDIPPALIPVDEADVEAIVDNMGFLHIEYAVLSFFLPLSSVHLSG